MAFIATAAIIGGGIAAAGGIAKLGMSLAGRKGKKKNKRTKSKLREMERKKKSL